ncbi:MAG: hypothetical protein ACK5HT_11620 [Draconibacterium sp.]
MQLSEKLELLNDDELQVVESGLNTLIRILDIETLEASPMLTLK